ncbi:MAG: hypothetical protein BWX80_03219 [Candidatus Hydrogenedentes bacterium ADurb.Bin101]|nr:MAG: hypothetical protein BWX80_03219 [Candidatus Hydrogenedentes bacterium ADurb.Bin101]
MTVIVKIPDRDVSPLFIRTASHASGDSTDSIDSGPVRCTLSAPACSSGPLNAHALTVDTNTTRLIETIRINISLAMDILFIVANTTLNLDRGR